MCKNLKDSEIEKTILHSKYYVSVSKHRYLFTSNHTWTLDSVELITLSIPLFPDDYVTINVGKSLT